jgi:hypothetical protein
MGRPVAFVSVANEGTPMLGVISTGDVDRTLLFEPVDVVTPVPPLATGRVPVIPVLSGRPVAFVSVANEGTPMLGVVSTGEVERTVLPEPVEVVTPVPPLATGRVPVTPVVSGRPVQLVSVPEVGVPSRGVTSVGEVAKTSRPEPVSLEIAAARLAEDGVARNVATLAPRPETPVEMGRPVAFVSVANEGTPMLGVTSTGEVERTLLFEPVEVVTPVPPLATGSVPVTPVVRGRPVALVSVANEGTPMLGVVSTGEVANTRRPEPVSLVIAAARLADVGVARNVATLVPRPETPEAIGKPVQFVSVPEVGVPSRGVTSVGEVASALAPEPVDVVTPVPPLVTARVPARVMVPEPVTGPPEVVSPVVPPETSIDVTVPPVLVEEIVIVPVPLVMVTPVPAVSVALVRVLPVVLPMSSWPLV